MGEEDGRLLTAFRREVEEEDKEVEVDRRSSRLRWEEEFLACSNRAFRSRCSVFRRATRLQNQLEPCRICPL